MNVHEPSDAFQARLGLAKCARWIARIGSVIVGMLLIGRVIGSWQSGERFLSLWEAVGFGLFPIGILCGMAIAWRYELIGGAVTVACLAGFYLWHFIGSGNWPGGPYLVILCSPGIVFLLAAWAERGCRPIQSSRQST